MRRRDLSLDVHLESDCTRPLYRARRAAQGPRARSRRQIDFASGADVRGAGDRHDADSRASGGRGVINTARAVAALGAPSKSAATSGRSRARPRRPAPARRSARFRQFGYRDAADDGRHRRASDDGRDDGRRFVSPAADAPGLAPLKQMGFEVGETARKRCR